MGLIQAVLKGGSQSGSVVRVAKSQVAVTFILRCEPSREQARGDKHVAQTCFSRPAAFLTDRAQRPPRTYKTGRQP